MFPPNGLGMLGYDENAFSPELRRKLRLLVMSWFIGYESMILTSSCEEDSFSGSGFISVCPESQFMTGC